jgi:hypothetical protein
MKRIALPFALLIASTLPAAAVVAPIMPSAVFEIIKNNPDIFIAPCADSENCGAGPDVAPEIQEPCGDDEAFDGLNDCTQAPADSTLKDSAEDKY